MKIAEFTWASALAGGVLIGAAALIMMVTIGRIAGISSIFSSLLKPQSSFRWQWAFIAGLFISGLAIHWLYKPVEMQVESRVPVLILAGLLVGFGARLGKGCTSGHGVCGISRNSPRSLTATALFMSMGMLVVFILKHMLA